MTGKKDELRAILQEGAAAIREMRRGMETACAGLQDFYGKALSRETDKTHILKPFRSLRAGEIKSDIQNFKEEKP